MLIYSSVFPLNIFELLQCLLKLILSSLTNPYVDLSCTLRNQIVNSQAETRIYNHNFQMTFHEVCTL